jgi:hypothetical protein
MNGQFHPQLKSQDGSVLVKSPRALILQTYRPVLQGMPEL